MKFLQVLFAMMCTVFSMNSINNYPADDYLKLSKNQDKVTIGFYNNESNLDITFAKNGFNQIFAIQSVKYYEDILAHQVNLSSVTFDSHTDWIGPYKMYSNKTTNLTAEPRFTGGWHGANADGTGEPTATCESITIFADGKQIKDLAEVQCKVVDIYVISNIKGYDDTKTGQPLIKEVVHYILDKNRDVKVEVQIVALQEVVIQKYYGMQAQNFPIFDTVSYQQEGVLLKEADLSANTDPGNRSGRAIIDEIILKDIESNHQIKMYLDTNTGLGTRSFLHENTAEAFTVNYGKTYFNLIDKNVVLKTGEELNWKGCYHFD